MFPGSCARAHVRSSLDFLAKRPDPRDVLGSLSINGTTTMGTLSRVEQVPIEKRNIVAVVL